MIQYFKSIPDNLISWINTQQIFWIATAPLTPDGHVNVSPKGVSGTFHVVNANKVWYEDLTGSGVETISHIRENGRITVMFNAFEGPPRILRLWGKGTVHEFGTPGYEALISPETRQPGSRSAIVVDIHKVGTSCGYSVPYFDFKGPRNTLSRWSTAAENRDFDFEHEPGSKADPETFPAMGMRYWRYEWNLKSQDGLPGIQVAHKTLLTSVVKNRHLKDMSLMDRPLKSGREFKVKKASEVTKNPENVKFLLAFLLGLLVATAFPKLSDALRLSSVQWL